MPGGANYELPPLHEDGKKQNKEYAKSKKTCLKRAEKNLEVEIFGDPSVMAEMLLVVVAVRAGVDGVYRIKSVTHRLNNKGYETKIHAEGPPAG